MVCSNCFIEPGSMRYHYIKTFQSYNVGTEKLLLKRIRCRECNFSKALQNSKKLQCSRELQVESRQCCLFAGNLRIPFLRNSRTIVDFGTSHYF